MPTPSNNLSDIIREYGKAFRWNWSDIDGRGVKMDMEVIASYVEAGKAVLSDDEAKSLRIGLGLCPNGCGYWEDDCEELNCDSK